MENKGRAQIEAYYKKEIESIKGEVVRLINLLEQMLSFKNGKGTFAQPPVKALSAHIPYTSHNLRAKLVTSSILSIFLPSSILKLKLSWI